MVGGRGTFIVGAHTHTSRNGHWKGRVLVNVDNKKIMPMNKTQDHGEDKNMFDLIFTNERIREKRLIKIAANLQLPAAGLYLPVVRIFRLRIEATTPLQVSTHTESPIH